MKLGTHCTSYETPSPNLCTPCTVSQSLSNGVWREKGFVIRRSAREGRGVFLNLPCPRAEWGAVYIWLGKECGVGQKNGKTLKLLKSYHTHFGLLLSSGVPKVFHIKMVFYIEHTPGISSTTQLFITPFTVITFREDNKG